MLLPKTKALPSAILDVLCVHVSASIHSNQCSIKMSSFSGKGNTFVALSRVKLTFMTDWNWLLNRSVS